jgi:hypothetical protein
LNLEDDVFIGFLSGLDVGSSNPISYKIQILVDYLTGNLGSTDELKFIAKISHLIVAGNSIFPPQKRDFREFDVRGVNLKKIKFLRV